MSSWSFRNLPWVPETFLARFQVSGNIVTRAKSFSRGFAAREKNLWYPGYKNLLSLEKLQYWNLL